MTPANPLNVSVETIAFASAGEPADVHDTRGGAVAPCWADWLEQIESALNSLQIQPGRTLVLVPYAQLMDAGRRAWAQSRLSGFPPRFESTRNWARTLQPFLPGPADLSMDMAHDSLVAAAFIDRVALGRIDAALRPVLVTRLVEAARQLAPLAAAMPPERRLAWADAVREVIAPGLQTLHWEAMLGSLALAWASTSAYATDVLWGPLAQPGADADGLLVLPGFQPDPLVLALAGHWGERAAVLRRDEADPGACSGSPARLHACSDAEDEAQRAAACVMAQVRAGCVPVALVANDRVLTRRVSAMLHGSGLTVRDETGWKLSTTHAAARLMSLLRAAHPRARMDDVLDLLKQAPAWPEARVQALEQCVREQGVSLWRAAMNNPLLVPVLPEGLVPQLKALQAARPLVQWLDDLTGALQACGLWELLETDPAGQQMIESLRLGEGAARELDEVFRHFPASGIGAGSRPSAGARVTLAGFTGWVRDVLEGASFLPRSPGEAAVVILPMAQMLGRLFPAAVVPGCDAVHLDPSPEPPGHWSAAQREALGLPLRAELAEAAASAWRNVLSCHSLDVLWRTQERGEAVLPGAWVQSLPNFGAQATSGDNDPRPRRLLAAQTAERPHAAAGDLMPGSLSASAYQDLRDCPYRFFALRQLRLVDTPELEGEPDQRDMGNWLHAVLRAFHEQRGDARPGVVADREALDRLADAIAEAMGLVASEDEAGFLPYQAVWPALRDGYLEWLAGYEASQHGPGPRFLQAEAALTAHAGPWQLYGKLDRIDQQDSPEGPIPFVIDYKTESRTRTVDRVREPLEDTQLAFYAALLPDDNVRAAYLSITDKRGQGPREAPTILLEQTEVLMAREQLREGLAHDMARVAAGQPMPALGEGRVCDFCVARGLCRKDFWSGT